MMVGGEAHKDIVASLNKLGVKRPLIVSDEYMAKSNVLSKITNILDEANIDWDSFTDTVPDPTTKVVGHGAAILRNGDFDGLIALGGGSPIDTAKAMAVLATHGGNMREYKVPNQVDDNDYPIIAIPTTAGTGSEVTRFTVITDTETDEKMLCMGLAYVPQAALIDYTLTLSMPWRLTADTGIDTLTHAIEAYVSKKNNPFADSMAKSCMELVSKHLRTACKDPNNVEAREGMMLAATQGGMAFSNSSVCMVHGMSRPLGAHFHIPHGLSNAMLLPSVTAYSAPYAINRYADCARAMKVAQKAETDEVSVQKLITSLKQLNTDLEVPSPSEYGIGNNKYFSLLGTMAEQALESGSPSNNPRVPSPEDIVAIYEELWE
tara:strand:+ start:1409 stop:2539 length:1131 start_codon:yes stop_codon:yes gene_type:complete